MPDTSDTPEALDRMTALATEVGSTIEETAYAVLDGSIRFDYE